MLAFEQAGSASFCTRMLGDLGARVIKVDISGYGSGGPLATRRAYDLLVQAEAGSCAITGRPGWPGQPAKPLCRSSPRSRSACSMSSPTSSAGLPSGAIPSVGQHTTSILDELGIDIG